MRPEYNRLEQLVTAFNKFYKSPKTELIIEPKTLLAHDIFSLLDDKKFLIADVTESQIFENCDRSSLNNYVKGFYSRYKNATHHFDNIVLSLLLSRFFNFYLPNTN